MLYLLQLLALCGVAAGQLIGPVGVTTELRHKTLECNIRHYGAIPDNRTDVAPALERTFNECVRHHRGSRLIVPRGEYLLNRSVVLSNATNWAFQLDGLITLAFGGDWNVPREAILQGSAGVEPLNSTINGEGDGLFLLNAFVIVNGRVLYMLRLTWTNFIKLSTLSSILPMERELFKAKAISIEMATCKSS